MTDRPRTTGRSQTTGRSRQPSLFESAAAAAVADAFDPARLTQARVLADLTKQALAAELHVSPAAVGQYEAGVITPRADHVEALARILGVPVAFFAAGRPHARLDASMAHFRSLRSTRVGQRAKAVAFVEQLWELAHALELRVELPPADLLPEPDHRPGSTPITPEATAQQLRQHWHIGPGPVRHLVRTMEMHGIIVALLPFAGSEEVARVDAFSTSRLPRPLVILTPDRANDVYRHRFTAAHELGHLLLHADANPGDIEQEREADRFAAELLTPAAEIGTELPPRLRIPALEPLSRRWGVALDSLVRRTRELGITSEISARRAYQRIQQLKAAGLLRPEPITTYPGETPTLLRSAFELAEQHGLTLTQLADELAWPIRTVRSRLGQIDDRPTLTLVREQ
jgi:Zn-dependent peptidase ImmA (M78 family)/transcriptional regulator with XRE-family HTH domain